MVERAWNFFLYLKNNFFTRDRFLMEVVASWVTMLLGVAASLSQVQLPLREAMLTFSRLPIPEVFVLITALPGLLKGIHYARMPGITHRWTTLVVMSSFVLLCAVSLLAHLDAWAFWTLLALLIGFNQGIALIIDLRDLRWACAMLATFFWVCLTSSTAVATGWPWPFGVIAFGGWAVANFLSMTRLSRRVA